MERTPFDNYEFRLLPRFLDVAKSIGKNLVDLLAPLPRQTFSTHGNHFQRQTVANVAVRGAEAFLAATMDEEGEAYEPTQLRLWE